MSDVNTKLRVSISRKNKKTDEYEQDFSGFVNVVGTAAAKKAMSLHEGDRIKLGDVDVTNRYNKEKKVTYTNFAIFSFDVEQGNGAPAAQAVPAYKPAKPAVDDGEVDDARLPF